MEKKVFKEGDKVFHIEYGWGIVIEDDDDLGFPIVVKFEDDEQASFSVTGKELTTANQPLLSFTEYTLQGFSQERPIDLPEVGEEVMVSYSGIEWSLGKFYKYKDGVFYTEDKNRTYFWNYLKRLR